MKFKTKETNLRSIAKSITFRIIATITTFALVWIFTGKFVIAFTIGLVDVLIKLLIYYFHERMWNKIKWGIKKE